MPYNYCVCRITTIFKISASILQPISELTKPSKYFHKYKCIRLKIQEYYPTNLGFLSEEKHD